MSDKVNKRSSGIMWNKPVPMKFFGAWEIDKTPPNCIPRLCTLTIKKLVLSKLISEDQTALIVAVKMQSTKRTLRSNEIIISCPSAASTTPGTATGGESSNGSIEIELDLTFALQYPHFLKKGGNQLHILLQRRKRYKNRAILGCKTLAGGVINMAEVLQRSNYMDKELELRENTKDLRKSEVVARILMSSLKSQPVDHEVNNGRSHKLSLNQSADGESDEDVDDFSQSEGSDSEPIDENGASARKWARKRRVAKQSLGAESLDRDNPNVHQRNLKQKFIALLKKFRLPDSEASDSEEQYREALEAGIIEAAAENIDNDDDDIFDFDDSDSTNEFDGFSVSSTPRPGLKPFFSSKTTLVDAENEEGTSAAKKKLELSNLDSVDKDFATSSSPKPSLRPFFSSKSTLVGSEAEISDANRLDYEPLDSSGTEQTPDTSDTSLKHPYLEDLNNKQKSGEKDKKPKAPSKASGVMSGGKNVKETITKFLKK